MPAMAQDYPTAQGDLTISEFMAEPNSVANYVGEWIEIYNASGRNLNLNGLLVRGDTTEDTGFTVNTDVTVAAGEYVVLGVGDCSSDFSDCGGETGYNGGVEVDFVYNRNDFPLNEDGDTIQLTYDGIVLDVVIWDSASWQVQDGYAQQANRNAFDLEWANDLEHNWCSSDAVYGELLLRGTPGSENVYCDDSNTDGDGDGWTEADGDCDDEDPYVKPDSIDGDEHDDGDYELGEGCCGEPNDDANCDGERDDGVTDNDGDGYTEVEGDCNDNNTAYSPDAIEILDGEDNDCNGCIDDIDDDGDTWTECEVWDEDGNPLFDCNDADNQIHPDRDEVPYDAIDNNCDGYYECDYDGDSFLAIPEEVCPDLDENGDNVLDCCMLEMNAPFGKSEGDCNDTDPDVNPNGTEGDPESGGQEDGIDNDCNGTVDDPWEDVDGDGYSKAEDCVDNLENELSAQIHPGAIEVCDDFYDNDCNGLYNDGCENRGRYSTLQGGGLCGVLPVAVPGSMGLLLLTLLAGFWRARGED